MLSFVKTCLTVYTRYSFSIFALHLLFSFQCAWRPLIESGAKTLASFYGGEYRVRTCDPLRARQVLSQLS